MAYFLHFFIKALFADTVTCGVIDTRMTPSANWLAVGLVSVALGDK
jgi:hypothetical protein